MVVVLSLVFVACAAAQIPYVSLVILFGFFCLQMQGRFDPVDILVIVVAAEPWLGSDRFFGFHLDRGLVVLTLASLWGAHGPAHRRFLVNRMDVTLCVFLVGCALSTVFSFMHREPVRILLDSLVIPFGYYLVAKNCVYRTDLLPKLYVGAVIAILSFGAFGLVEAMTKVDYLSFGESELDPFRINGPFRRAADFGICISLLLLYCFAMKSARGSSPVGPRVLRLLPALGIMSCYFTLTRGIWIAFAAGWLVQAARRNLSLVLRVTPPLAVAAWIIFQFILPQIAGEVWEKRVNNDRTINARIATYKSALAMFVDHPLFGVGFAAFNEMVERFPERYEKFHNGEPSVTSPHNIIMCLMSETGVIGVVTFVIFVVQAFICSFTLARHAHQDYQREYATFMISVLVTYLVAGMGLHIIRNIDFISKYLFIFLGIGSGMVDSCLSKRQVAGAARGSHR